MCHLNSHNPTQLLFPLSLFYFDSTFPFIFLFSANMKVIYNPGGFASGRFAQRKEDGNLRRHRYTKLEKLRIIAVLEKLQADEGLNVVDAASVLQVDPACLSRWVKAKDDLQANPKTTGNKLSMHEGPVGILKDIEMDLLNYIEEWRQKGFEVNRFTLLRKAGQLRPAILGKSIGAAKICISRFLTKNNLTHRVATHKAQRDPREVESEGKEFLEYIRPRLTDGSRHPDFILNMDQTPVYHSMDSSRTIERVGARTVNVRVATNDSMRVTVAVTVTASGQKVKSMVVFKGEFNFINHPFKISY